MKAWARLREMDRRVVADARRTPWWMIVAPFWIMMLSTVLVDLLGVVPAVVIVGLLSVPYAIGVRRLAHRRASVGN